MGNLQPSHIASKIWRNRQLPGIEFTRSQYTTYQFTPHFHDHYVIQLVESGVNEGKCDRTDFQAVPGEVLIIHPGEVHTGNSFRGKLLTYTGICMTQEFAGQLARNLQVAVSPTPEFCSMLIRDQELAQRLTRLISLAENPHDSLALEESSTDFFGHLINHYHLRKGDTDTARKDRNKVLRIKGYIRDHFQRSITLQELSEYAAISPYHLIRIFKARVGITPFEYLRNIRIEMAKKMLSGPLSLIEIAHQCGFYDQSHFIRNFKRITGLTPTGYRGF